MRAHSRHVSPGSASHSSLQSRSPSPLRPRSAGNRVAGPSLPPGFRRSSPRSDRSDQSEIEDEEFGPVPLPTGALPSEDGVSAATREFLEREKRSREAAIEAELAAQAASTARPEWMLQLPTTSSALSSIAADPTRLKSRGFSQTAARVQRRQGAGASNEASSSSLWSETPEQRAQRLHDEVSGKRTEAGADVPDEAKNLQRLVQARRDAVIQAQLEKEPSRATTLLELHKEKRRREVRDKEKEKERERNKGKGKSHDGRHRSRREETGSSDAEEATERDRSKKRRHRSDRDRSRSPSPSSSKRSGRTRDNSHERHRRHRHDSHQHRDRHSRDRRHRGGSDSGEDQDGNTEERRKRRRADKEKRRERRERDKDADKDADKAKQKRNAGTTAPVIWDRDAALGVGGKLMDEKSRGRMIQDAAALGSRFGSGSSRFL
ncbi:hypothetical protein ACQY0O_007467 [Thecaphora frezii]